MRKVVFLDRDGVINIEPGHYTYEVDRFKLVTGLQEALTNLKKRGYEFIVITNQGGIAKEIYGHKEVHILHTFMRKQLEQAGITLLAIYYCPHHTSYGKCICRKPNSLLLEKAIAKYEVAIESSYFIGDSERDIEAGNRAGLKSILIKSNDNLTHYLNQID